MNKQQAHAFLMDLLSNILFHALLLGEVSGFIAGSGFEKSFETIIKKQLRLLSVLGRQATDMAEFERLDDTLYSMHISGKGFNYRILYGFLPNNQPVLLLGFEEKAGKRKTEYGPHIDPAMRRMREMEEVFEHE